MIWIYSANTTDFSNNGLGELTDVLKYKVTEVINGDYQLDVIAPINCSMAEYLVEGNILKADVGNDNFQPFRIKRVTKDFRQITIFAQHIFYDLLNNIVINSAPSNLNAASFGTWILEHLNYDTSFTFSSDITATASARYVRKNPVECMIGTADNSMINLFGGEIVRDGFNISLNANRGHDRGVRLLVGKNITAIQIVADITALTTRIVPLGFDGLMLPEIYVDSPLIENYPTPKVAKVDFNDIKYDPEDPEAFDDIEDAYDALRNRCVELFNSGVDLPALNIKVNWLELSKIDEYRTLYQDLERVSLGDTITVQLLGYNYQTEVVKTVYNGLTDMIESFEIGTISASITTAINNAGRNIENQITQSILEAARSNATDLINSAMGGYIYKTDSELYIMDAPTPEEAVRVWRWNINGLGYSSSGINGTYETAITMDGQIVADFITTGTLSTSVIQGIDQIVLRIDSNENAINEFHNYFAFGDDGLTVGKQGSDYKNVVDNQGMTVFYNDNAVLTANDDGVGANAFVVDYKWNIDTLDNDGYVLGFYRR